MPLARRSGRACATGHDRHAAKADLTRPKPPLPGRSSCLGVTAGIICQNAPRGSASPCGTTKPRIAARPKLPAPHSGTNCGSAPNGKAISISPPTSTQGSPTGYALVSASRSYPDQPRPPRGHIAISVSTRPTPCRKRSSSPISTSTSATTKRKSSASPRRSRGIKRSAEPFSTASV